MANNVVAISSSEEEYHSPVPEKKRRSSRRIASSSTSKKKRRISIKQAPKSLKEYRDPDADSVHSDDSEVDLSVDENLDAFIAGDDEVMEYAKPSVLDFDDEVLNSDEEQVRLKSVAAAEKEQMEEFHSLHENREEDEWCTVYYYYLLHSISLRYDLPLQLEEKDLRMLPAAKGKMERIIGASRDNARSMQNWAPEILEAVESLPYLTSSEYEHNGIKDDCELCSRHKDVYMIEVTVEGVPYNDVLEDVDWLESTEHSYRKPVWRDYAFRCGLTCFLRVASYSQLYHARHAWVEDIFRKLNHSTLQDMYRDKQYAKSMYMELKEMKQNVLLVTIPQRMYRFPETFSNVWEVHRDESCSAFQNESDGIRDRLPEINEDSSSDSEGDVVFVQSPTSVSSTTRSPILHHKVRQQEDSDNPIRTPNRRQQDNIIVSDEEDEVVLSSVKKSSNRLQSVSIDNDDFEPEKGQLQTMYTCMPDQERRVTTRSASRKEKSPSPGSQYDIPSAPLQQLLPPTKGDQCTVCQKRPRSGCVVHGQYCHIYACYPCAYNAFRNDDGCQICHRKIDNVFKYIALPCPTEQ